ncbi:ParB/RepB/Spo0J family partition protein [Streptomyces sp. RB6PN25]|uniref:ParB/RepB/Spo0J family partition protein n=1 Tax=Streptomyces humicola TaxID=2953240 RepID=A0ABT1Q405_9ACTN|nr:ParB/RepB/Spo0J family partition protein [Streptomyces humicola]MCQ4083510.1 ParB/RepB/Spo0J family partition protein [Streptomyces humicola]
MRMAAPSGEPARTGSGYIAALFETVDRLPVETVFVARLGESLSVRTQLEDVTHTRRLADSGDEVPPILVHRESLRVIDGLHRMRAAVLNGRRTIEVKFFDGPEHDAFLLAVAANVKHGLPLNAGERHDAARQVAAMHPDWSNRAIAAVAGISPHRVAEIRRSGGTAAPATTIGLDGRSRPVDGSEGRRRAAELFLGNPEYSIREVARRAAISPSTAADVKTRILRNANPLPPRMRGGQGPGPARRDEAPSAEGMAALFDTLCRDPSLRFSESGRTLLRMFEACARVDRQRDQIVHDLPAHRAETVHELLLACAERWRSMAGEVRTAQRGTRQSSAS